MKKEKYREKYIEGGKTKSWIASWERGWAIAGKTEASSKGKRSGTASVDNRKKKRSVSRNKTR